MSIIFRFSHYLNQPLLNAIRIFAKIMIRKLVVALLLLLVLSGHDMYFKLDTYFLAPNTDATILLFNGTFEKSDNVISRDRMIDVSLVGNGNRIAADSAQWTEQGETTLLNFKTAETGTWVAGVSTAPRIIEMSAEDFNNYLQHDGVLDMLEWRKQNNAMDQNAVEKYAKHVKTIFQVGDKLSDDWQTVLGYPIEFVPLSNPYDLHAGHDMQVQLLLKGKPLANQLVYIGSEAKEHNHDDSSEHSHSSETSHSHEDEYEHNHDSEAEHAHEHESEEVADHHHDLDHLRTDDEGKITFEITKQGIWYLRAINLTTSEEAGLTHESNWATLTFEIGDGHIHSHDGGNTHTHDDEDDALGIPSYAYWIGSLLLVFGLFLWFNRKKS